MDPEQQIARMQKGLNLSEDQTNQIRPILNERQQQLMALRDDTATPRNEKLGKMRTIVQDSDGKIMAVLNDDQKAKYSQFEQQMRDRMRQRMQERKQGSSESNNQ